MDGRIIILCDRIIAALLLSTPVNKGDDLTIPYRNQSEGHRIFGLKFSVCDRRKARQNRLKTEERYAKVGIEEYQVGNQQQKQAATSSHDRLHQRLEVSTIANTSTFRQEKRSLHAHGRLSKPSAA